MALFLDSAHAEHATRAQALGFVSGITINPLMIRDTGQSGLDVLQVLVKIFDGHVFYQLTAPTLEARLDEAWHAYDLRPDRVVVKLAASTENLGLIRRISEIEVAITAVYSPIQAYAAAEAGAQYVIPASVLNDGESTDDGLSLVRQIAQLLDANPTGIIVDGVQSLDRALLALQAGADHVALPVELLESVGDHPSSARAIEEWRS